MPGQALGTLEQEFCVKQPDEYAVRALAGTLLLCCLAV